MSFSKILIALILISLTVSVAAHTETKEPAAGEITEFLPLDPFQGIIIASIIILLILIISFALQNSLSNQVKKILFVIIVIATVLPTLYLAGSTVYLNLISESEGPIHWHADFEIEICGEKINKELIESEGLSNKVGNSVFHHHNDYRIHVEGVLIKKSQASLGNFFKVIGGEFEKSHLRIPLKNGKFKEVRLGDKCPNGKPGKLKLLVLNRETEKFEENPLLDEYVLKPFELIPPGDELKIVFDSENGSEK